MVETISDFLSVFTVILIFLASLYMLYSVIVSHREASLKSIERRYYRYYENVDDEDDSNDRNEPYFED